MPNRFDRRLKGSGLNPGDGVCTKKNTNNRMLHNSGYDFNDEILPIGSSYWARLVETELSS